jgi:hypothetical protein
MAPIVERDSKRVTFSTPAGSGSIGAYAPPTKPCGGHPQQGLAASARMSPLANADSTESGDSFTIGHGGK